MSGRINLSNLSDSLKEYLNGLGLTEAQVQELIDKFEDEKIGDISQLSTEEKGSLVGAINEVKDTIDNKDLSAYQTVEDNDLLTENKTIVEAINEIYNSHDVIKQKLVASLLAKGLGVNTDMDIIEIIDHINTSTLIKPAGNAVASNVLSGKTFINSTGTVVTGTMTNNGSKTINPTASTQTLGAGYYYQVTIKGDSNLKASNIKSGVNIFGVTGTAPYIYTTTFDTGSSEGYSISHSFGKKPSTWNLTISDLYCIKSRYPDEKYIYTEGSITLSSNSSDNEYIMDFVHEDYLDDPDYAGTIRVIIDFKYINSTVVNLRIFNNGGGSLGSTGHVYGTIKMEFK